MSEKKGGKKKRWFEQFYPKSMTDETPPQGSVSHSKLPVMVLRKQGKHTKACKCAAIKAKTKAS